MQGQMQIQPRGSARFKVVGLSFHSRYECKPENTSDEPSPYTIGISNNPKKRPDLALTVGGVSVATRYLPETSKHYNSDPKIFRIGLGNLSDVYWIAMLYQGKDKYGWSFAFNIPTTGQPVQVTWKKDKNVVVNDMSASRPKWPGHGDFYESHYGIRSQRGLAFEAAVIMSLLYIYVFQKCDEEKRSGTASAADSAAAKG
ncbi:hypothetical protein NW762_010142 [Fusarium torreyae]|uniref:Uncharacterized protein n=1 Tax=Fusarium torreyae TaxID=1237075 RepID=A0A9W8RRM2_9HYPO|nr:hypothetical protein NW762_010142 [Fusarium torreyae]